MLSIILLPITVLLTAVLIWRNFKKRYAFANVVPLIKPPKLSFTSCTNSTLLKMTDEKRFKAVDNCFRQQNGLFRMWTGPFMMLGVSHPDLMQKILSHPDCLEKPYFYRFVKYNQGIFSAKYKLWKSQRKALNPTFNIRILHSFIPIFVECSKKLVTELSKRQDGETINMFNYTSRCALEMVCGTTLGSDVLQREGKDEFLEALEIWFNIVSRRLLSVHLHLDLIYMLTPTFWKEMRLRQQCRVFASEILQERKTALLRSNKKLCNDDEDYKKPQLFIDQLLSISNSSRPFTEEEIFHNVFVIMAAGNDTSALAVAYTCVFLAMYPQYQERVYAEIMEHFPNDNVEITPESLKLLEYLEMFIKEVLRHCPVAATISRECVKDVEFDGMRIPAGNTFVFSIWRMHRRKDMWGPDAEEFDPDNFLPERCQARNPNAYMPFSVGARNCIGARYAMISVKIVLAYIVRNFKLHTKLQHRDLRYKFGITLKLAMDHSVQLENRIK